MSTQTNTPTIISTTHIKLTRENYPFWKAQIVPNLQAHDLFGHVDGSITCPPKTIHDATTDTNTVNPAFTIWYHKDKLILSAIISSLTEGTLAPVVGLDTA
jgi:hypothetical protein